MLPRRDRQRFTRIIVFALGIIFGQLFISITFPLPHRPRPNFDTSVGVPLSWDKLSEVPTIPKVFVVTPTFRRPNQLAELTRVAQAIHPVRQFVNWILIDEFEKSSEEHVEYLKEFVSGFSISVTVVRSRQRKPWNKTIKGKVAKGVASRRTGIRLQRNTNNMKGVIYFADDDNTYDSDVFRQMQSTEKVSMWPVGCITQLVFSSPFLKNGEIKSFYDGFQAGRKFPVDFAEFAINLDVLHANPNGNIPYRTSYEETKFLMSLGIEKHQIEVLADKCTEVMAWHTKTIPTVARNLIKRRLPYVLKNSNIGKLYERYPFL